jgi:hypothetical protein
MAPFLIATKRLWWAAALQVVVVGPAILGYALPWEAGIVVPLYVVPTLALWAVCAVAVTLRLLRPPAQRG